MVKPVESADTESTERPWREASDAALAGFARSVVERLLYQGFLSLSKRDLDLLLFFELEHAGIVSSHADNHTLGQVLRLTPTKVKSLRRDAYARWAGAAEVREHLRASLQRCFEPARLTTMLSENADIVKAKKHLPLLLEHPSDWFGFEQLLKQRGSVPRYARNPEVLLVPVSALLELLPEVLGSEPTREAIRSVQRTVKETPTLKGFLTKDLKDLTWGEAREVLNGTLATAIEKAATDSLVTLLAGTFGPLLGAPKPK